MAVLGLLALASPVVLVIGTQAIVAAGPILAGILAVLVVAAPTYGIPHVAHPAQTLLGPAAGTVTLVLAGVALGLAAPSVRSAQRSAW